MDPVVGHRVLQLRRSDRPGSEQDVAGFFDQFEFTPNKGKTLPVEVGISDGALDVFRPGGNPLLQVRLASPTSNLGASGSQIDEPFFDQRLDALTRLPGVDFDLRYDRMRTEQLRLVPNTANAGLRSTTGCAATTASTGTAPDSPGGPFRPQQAFGAGGKARSRPPSSLRWRRRTPRCHDAAALPPRSRPTPGSACPAIWTATSRASAGLVAPWRRFTLALDFDRERLDVRSAPFTEADLGFPPPFADRIIDFVPSSDRTTGAPG